MALTGFESWMPESHILAVWVAISAGFIGALNVVFDGSSFDNLLALAVLLVCLPFLSPRWSNSELLCIGYVVHGIIIGIQLIDFCFDVLVLRNSSIRMGSHPDDVISARKVAWLYYHNVVSAPHVNVIVSLCVLLLLFGSLACISRSTTRQRFKWAMLVGCMVVGNGGYVFIIVPYYIRIRTEAAFDSSIFDGWGVVFAARLATISSIIAAWPFMLSLQAEDHKVQSLKAA